MKPFTGQAYTNFSEGPPSKAKRIKRLRVSPPADPPVHRLSSHKVPQPFIEAMKRLTSDMSANTQPAQKASTTPMKWKSSFMILDGKRGSSKERNTDGSERSRPDQVYDPYSPLTSDNEADQPHSLFLPSPDMSLQRQRPSPSLEPQSAGRWDIPCPPESKGRLSDKQVLDSESNHHPSFASRSGSLKRTVCSPDKPDPDPPTKRLDLSYEELRANGNERRLIPTPSSLRFSPKRLQQEYQVPSSHRPPGIKPNPTTTHQTGNINKVEREIAVTCELCDIVLANKEELQDHLDSKSHWDTLEHIQKNNKYDDPTIAFLQDVLLYKSHQCSRAVQESALQALHENDCMTKVEMFHCAACKVFVFTSAAETNGHITSLEHLANTKEFKLKQRHLSLSRAETVIAALQPQFEVFLKGSQPFE